MKRIGMIVASCAALAAVPALTSCSELAAMDAETSCRDFLQAPLDEQNAALARIADELGTRNTLTPLGRPNIDYLCSSDQDQTLGEVVESTG